MNFSSALATIVTATALTCAASCTNDAYDPLAESAPAVDSDLSEATSTEHGFKFVPRYLDLLNLANCYATGVDAIGVAELDQGRAILANCLTEDVEINIDFPGVGTFAFAQLNDFTNFVNDFFSGSGYVRTQHHVSNVVSGPFGRTMRSYISATHVLPDGRVDLDTVVYDDEIDFVDGRWRIVRRDIFISSGVQLSP